MKPRVSDYDSNECGHRKFWKNDARTLPPKL